MRSGKMKKSPRLPNPAKPRYSLRRDLKMNWQLYLMAAPAVILLFIFGYMMDFGAIMAFQELDYNKGLFTSPFVGFKNFEYLFAGTTIWRVTRNTVFYNLAFMAVNSLTSIGLALIINEMTNKKVSKVIQTILIMPYFLSMVVVSIIVYSFLAYNSGFLNNTLIKFGLDKQNWYKMPEVWPYFIVFINMWKNVGFSSITYTAIISGIPQEYYEASTIDGASRWQQCWKITLPHMKTIIAIGLINSLSAILSSDFDLFYVITKNDGALYSTTQVLSTYTYNALRSMSNLGMTAAAGLYVSFIGMLLVLLSNYVVKKIDPDSAMF